MKKNYIMAGAIALLGAFFVVHSISIARDNSTELPKTIKVGITMYNEYDPFTEDIRHNIEEYLKEYGEKNNVEVYATVMYSGKNQFVQNDQVEDFIDDDYDVVCVNIVDRTDPSAIIEKAKANDTPIIFFNRELVEDDLNRFSDLYYVGARPEVSGEIQGRIVIDAVKERMEEIDVNNDGVLQYVLLEGEAGHQDAIIRSRVSVETIKDAGIEMEMLGDEIANWDRKQAQTKITSLLAGYPRQIELIIANDDNMALGALDALKAFGVTNYPLIVGVNGQAEVFEEIQNGMIEGTALNNAKEKGRVIAELAVALGTTGTAPEDISLEKGKYYYVPYELINRENVGEYLTTDIR